MLNKLEMIQDILTQRSYITYNKGGNWRLLEAPKEVRHMCYDQDVSCFF